MIFNQMIYMNRKWEDIYQRVEWISNKSSDDKAYIDTGIAYSHGCTIDLHYIDGPSGLQNFGAAEKNGAKRCMLSPSYILRSANSKVGTFYTTYQGTSALQFREAYYDSPYRVDGTKINMHVVLVTGSTPKITTQYGTYDDGNTGRAIIDFTMTNTLYLCAQNYNGTARNSGINKIRYFKYADASGNVLREMIPCYRKADGAVGMWDNITQRFFTNAGSSELVKGPNVDTNTPNYTNLFIASESQDNHRYNSSGAAVEVSGAIATNVFYTGGLGHVLRVKGMNPSGTLMNKYVWCSNESGSVGGTGVSTPAWVNEGNGVYSYTLAFPETYAKISFEKSGAVSDIIITIDEPIV